MKEIEEVLEEFEKKMGLTHEKQEIPVQTFETLGELRDFITKALLQRDQEWLKRIEELPAMQKEEIKQTKRINEDWESVEAKAGLVATRNMLRQEILNNIKEL